LIRKRLPRGGSKVKKLATLRQGWIDAKATQTESGTAAQSARAELKAMLKSIENRKLAIGSNLPQRDHSEVWRANPRIAEYSKLLEFSDRTGPFSFSEVTPTTVRPRLNRGFSSVFQG
jgi:hypothetical protein